MALWGSKELPFGGSGAAETCNRDPELMAVAGVFGACRIVSLVWCEPGLTTPQATPHRGEAQFPPRYVDF